MKQLQLEKFLVKQQDQQPSPTIVQDTKSEKKSLTKTAASLASSSSSIPKNHNKMQSTTTNKTTKEFFQEPTPNSKGRQFSFQQNIYNTLNPVFEFYLPRKKGLKVTGPKDCIKRLFSLYEIAHFLRELGRMIRVYAVGYSEKELQQYSKKYKKLLIFDSLIGVLEGSPIALSSQGNSSSSTVEKELFVLVMDLYKWLLQYMSTSYEPNKDFFIFLRQMREALPKELKERMALTTTRLSFFINHGVTNAMQVPEFRAKQIENGGGWNYTKILATLLSRYGITHPMQKKEFREKQLRNCYQVLEFEGLEYQGRNELCWLMILKQRNLLQWVTNKNMVLLHPSGITYAQDFEITNNFTIDLDALTTVQVYAEDVIDVKSTFTILGSFIKLIKVSEKNKCRIVLPFMNYTTDKTKTVYIKTQAFGAWITIDNGKVTELFIENPKHFCLTIINLCFLKGRTEIAVEDGQLLIWIVASKYQLDIDELVQATLVKGKISEDKLIKVFGKLWIAEMERKVNLKQIELLGATSISELCMDLDEELDEENEKTVCELHDMNDDSWNNLLFENVLLCDLK